MTSIRRMLLAIKEIGPGKVARQIAYRTLLRSGYLKWKTPRQRWADFGLTDVLCEGIVHSPEKYGDYKRAHPQLSMDGKARAALYQHLEAYRPTILKQADEILEGKYPAFGTMCVDMGVPPDWLAFLPLGEHGDSPSMAADKHWTDYNPDSMPVDIKLLWELSRFGWIYPLVRAYLVSGASVYLQRCLDLLRDWQAHNPPNTGPQWVSAQEAGLRILAMAFLIQGAGSDLVQEDWELLALLTSIHADRIPPTLLYARAQANNHLLVEAAALLTAGVMFPELKHALRWEKSGRRELEKSYPGQVFPDGGYVQHSHNYARIALQAGLWTLFVAKKTGRPLSGKVEDALRRLSRGLRSMLDESDGRLPNFGPNDGALIRPLSTCSFEDYRPVIQAASLLLDKVHLFPSGPWDEELLWLGCRIEGSQGPSDGEMTSAASLKDAGLYRLQGETGWAALRCAVFQGRPGHADQLHVDIWRKGMNLLVDPGTYQYNAEPPWENPFSGSAVHNTAWLAGEEPMQRAGRFLWLNWDQAEMLGRWRSKRGNLEAVSGQHGNLRRKFLHRRTLVRIGEVGWIIADDFHGSEAQGIRCGWNLAGTEWTITKSGARLSSAAETISLDIEGENYSLTLIQGGRVIAGEPIEEDLAALGWFSPTYAVKDPCTHIAVRTKTELPFRIVTRMVFNQSAMDNAAARWTPINENGPSLQSIVFAGESLECIDAYLVDPSSLRRAG